MKHVAFALMGLLAALPAGALELEGQVTQGALVLGRAAPGAQVWLGEAPLRVAPDGRFAFAIGRDDTGVVELRVKDQGREETLELPIETREFRIERVDGVPPRTVNIPPEEQARRKKERAMVLAARAVPSDAMYWTEGFAVPVENARISGVYGSQRILNGEPRWPHFGIDYAAPTGTPVKAPAAGTVKLAEPDFLLEGGLIIIDHGYGISSTLMHLSSVDVAVGDKVEKGDVVAKVGMTGRATGPHLDWRINVGEVRVDPALALELKPEKLND